MHEYTVEVQTLLDLQLTIDAWIQLSNCENSRAWKKVLSLINLCMQIEQQKPAFRYTLHSADRLQREKNANQYCVLMFLLQSSYLHPYYDPKNQSNRKHPIVGREVLDLKIKNKRVPFMRVTEQYVSMGTQLSGLEAVVQLQYSSIVYLFRH